MYLVGMSAAEIIEQIKALPAEEQAKIAEFVRELQSASGKEPNIRYVDRDNARGIANRVFEENAELFRKLAK